MEEAEDPFASIIKNGIITASQEEKLGNCPLARQSEASPERSNSFSFSPEPAAVVMVSPPGRGQNTSLKSGGASRVPPELATSSSQPYRCGSEYPRPSTSTAAVDSELKAPGDEHTAVDEEGCTENQRVVGLGKECGDLGFPKHEKFNRGGGISGGNNEHMCLMGDKKEGASKRSRIRMQSPTLNKDKDTEVVDSECEEIVDQEEKEKTYENCRKISGSKRKMESRELPLSMGSIRGEKEDTKNGSFKELMEALQPVFGKPSDGGFKELMEALQPVLGKSSDGSFKDISILETAKQQGWNFPRPRWWPPKGFDDEDF